MSVNSKMTALADEVRTLAGTTVKLGIDAMATNVQSANAEVVSQTSLLAQAIAALEGKTAGGGSAAPILQNKTVTPTTAIQQVQPDTGYDGLFKVTVNAMPTATQATPNITVSSAGLITASATQSAGYVAAGTKSATKQLTVQATQTITPGTSDQTIASGRYLTGVQTIKGDANLIAENIAEGVNIFGIIGTHSGGGGSMETCTVTLTDYADTAHGTTFSDGQLSYNLLTNDGIHNSGSFVKNTVITVIGKSARYSNCIITGDATNVYSEPPCFAIQINGDCSIAVTS